MSWRLHLWIGMISFIVVIILTSFDVGSVTARTITVDDDGGTDYIRIQDAIDNATNGDTIRVFEGTYYERVRVNITVSLIGNGSDVTTIDRGERNGDVVRITADHVNFSGFRITGGNIRRTGIAVESEHCHIFMNNCSNNFYGIYVRPSSNHTITDNICENNSRGGIFLDRSSKCTITNNTCSRNMIGIGIASSTYCLLTNNAMHMNGISITGFFEHWNSHILDTMNTVNGKPVYYLKNETGLTVPLGAGQVILANCTLMNVTNQDCSNGSVGILIGYSQNLHVMNNICSGSQQSGIHISSSSNCTISNNTCLSNNEDGIRLSRSDTFTLEENTCSSNGENGIRCQIYRR